MAGGELAGACPTRVPRKRKRPGAAMARDKPEAAAESEAAPELSYREQLDFLNPIAQPLASRKLTRKLLKCIRKGLAVAGLGRGWDMAAAWCGAPRCGSQSAPHAVVLLQRPSRSRSAAV